jgi:nucleoside-diphosphate-sugar epimerase
MVYTGNLVDALLAAEVAPSAPGQAYWVADAEPYELRSIVDTVRRALEAEGLPGLRARRAHPRHGRARWRRARRRLQARAATCSRCTCSGS